MAETAADKPIGKGKSSTEKLDIPSPGTDSGTTNYDNMVSVERAIVALSF